MPRYDEIYDRLARRALLTAEIDLDTFFEDAVALGMSPDAIEAALLDDLFNEGPIFGKFLNNAVGASEGTVMEAGRQGTFVGQLTEERRAFLELSDDDIDAMLDGADPEALADVEINLAEVVRETWIAELVNTCHRCLPLHGTTLSRQEWSERGLHPSSIHSGWNSACHCRLVDEALAQGREDLVAPLKRERLQTTTGLKGDRKTRRSIAQKDIDKAQAARDAALDTPEGRRTLRLLGQANPTGFVARGEGDDVEGLFQ